MQVSKRETVLAALIVLILVKLAFLPYVPQSQAYHHFADHRALFGMPNAADSLSNLPFLLIGAAGLILLAMNRLDFTHSSSKAWAGVFFTGLIATGIGSTWYHVAPDDAGLVVDRFGMVVAFAGALGLAGMDRISNRAGRVLGIAAIILGPVSVLWWQRTGNVAPYGLMQYGVIAILVWISCLKTLPHDGVHAMPDSARKTSFHWLALVGAYAIAKLFEANDEAIFQLTGHVVSGHTLKHLAAASAALVIILPLMNRNGARRGA